MKGARENFGGRFAVLVALVGSAVGLGNLWRFPYLVGNNGGAAFILIYIVLTFLLCLPIMHSEIVIGRRSKANVFGAFNTLAPGSKWKYAGVLALVTTAIILGFYAVVGGWSLFFFIKALFFQLNEAGGNAAEPLFTSMASATCTPLIYAAAFMIVTALVIACGVRKGIEKYSKIMMPVLFVCTVIIAIESISLPGAMRGVEFLLYPDFSNMTPDTVLNALGQAFFSLSLGCGTFITYSSYMKSSENILKVSLLTALWDTIFAILAGLAIMPAVFAFSQEPSQGPGLLFIILPDILSKIPFGGLISILFFAVVFLAALTSSISMLEIITSYTTDEFKWSRKRSVVTICSIIFILTTLCSLSMGPLASFKIFGKTIFELCDFLTANVMLTCGSLAYVIFVGWIMKRSDVLDELTNGGTIKIAPQAANFLLFSIKYLAPAAILIITAYSLFF